MNKKSKAKEQQGYIEKPLIKNCANCAHYSSEFIKNQWGYFEEKNIRCGIGGFSVKKKAICNIHENPIR